MLACGVQVTEWTWVITQAQVPWQQIREVWKPSLPEDLLKYRTDQVSKVSLHQTQCQGCCQHVSTLG